MIKAVYIHIPFCKNICAYCDFSKLYYHPLWVKEYISSLIKEIRKDFPRNPVQTIYIGGGSPSALTEEEIKPLFELILEIPKMDSYEFTVECNIEDITEEKIAFYHAYGVNRISYGVETFHSHHLHTLFRHHIKEMVEEKIQFTKKYIPNINVDLMYALPDETLKEVETDLVSFLSLDVPHISTYSLMIEPHTVFGNQKIESIPDRVDADMYDAIRDSLTKHGYSHYEISNFAKPTYESKHNLTYWNNEEYYGYGLGASGYIDHVRYTNTRNLTKYLKGNNEKTEEKISQNEMMIEEMILGLRKIEGVSKRKFYEKFSRHMEEVFPIKSLLDRGLLVENGDYILIHPDYLYLSNEILIEFI